LSILLSQEIHANCLYLLEESAGLEEDALVLLNLILCGDFGELRQDDIEKTFQCLEDMLNKNSSDELVLQAFYEGILKKFWSPGNDVLLLLTENFLKEGVGDKALAFTVEIITRTMETNPSSKEMLLGIFLKGNVDMVKLINQAVEQPKLFGIVRELLRLLSLLTSHSSDPVSFRFEELKIPKFFEL
jgi:hypothetical protein